MKTIEELKRLNEAITNDKIGRSKRPWYGAGIAVVKEQTKKHSEGFYPDPFFVESNKFSLEISWMFEQLRDAFYAEDLLDGWTKEEFFGRLARAANRGIFRNNEDCQVICMEILKEAQQIYGEITSNTFEVLPIGTENIIADDLKEEYIESFEDTADIVEGNLSYFIGTRFKDYDQYSEQATKINDKKKDVISNESNFQLESHIKEVSFDGIKKEYFLKEVITNKKTGKKLSFYICRTNALYSSKTKNFRETVKEQGLIGVVTLKNKFFVSYSNHPVSLVIFGENPATKFFSSANSFEELYNLIFDKKKYKRAIFYCNESDVDYDNLLPENYDSKNTYKETDKSNIESVQELANQILSNLKQSKLEESVLESLKKAGWKESDISRKERFKYENKYLIPDFTLYSEGEPFAFVEVKNENRAVMAINQLKAIQRENNILAILSLGSLYFEVYKCIDGNYKIYKFISGAPTKQELLKIFKEEK